MRSRLLFPLWSVACLCWSVGGAWAAEVPGPIPVVVSEETTLITKPLAADGLPDYAAAILIEQGRGVSAEKNGAVDFWRAVGPGSLRPREQFALFTELGCSLPSSRGALERLPRLNGAELDPEGAVAAALASRPWDGERLNVVARWLERNRGALGTARRGLTAPAFYSPPPNLLSRPPDSLTEAYLVDIEEMRRVTLALSIDAMHRLGQEDEAAASADADALRCIATRWMRRLTAFGLVDAVKYARTASRIDQVRIDRAADREAVERVLREVAGHRYVEPQWGARYAGNETCMALDAIVRNFSDRQPLQGDLATPPGDGAGDRLSAAWRRGDVDPNEVLKAVVTTWGRIEQLSRLTPPERLRAWRTFDQALIGLDPVSVREASLAKGDSTPTANGKCIGAVFITHLFPNAKIGFNAVDTIRASKRMTALAAALKLHRLEHGRYPETLAEVAPTPPDTVPVDPFTGEAFRYERRGDGFALWSVGPNRVDDGGSDPRGGFVDGDFAPVDWSGARPAPDGPDDLVVRLPIPELDPPAEFATAR